jgi:hypothetical protein
MSTMKLMAASIIVLAAGLAGCDRTTPTTSEPTSPTSAASAPAAATSTGPATPTATPDPAQAWLGRWNGPEGTYLQLNAADGAGYEVRIKDLDAERTFKGVAKDGAIHFERDGKQESIKATDGDATGMKWLAGKKTCLTVHPGEGYCRD